MYDLLSSLWKVGEMTLQESVSFGKQRERSDKHSSTRIRSVERWVVKSLFPAEQRSAQEFSGLAQGVPKANQGPVDLETRL